MYVGKPRKNILLKNITPLDDVSKRVYYNNTQPTPNVNPEWNSHIIV